MTISATVPCNFSLADTDQLWWLYLIDHGTKILQQATDSGHFDLNIMDFVTKKLNIISAAVSMYQWNKKMIPA